MRVAEALTTVTRLFLDTAPIIYYVERHPQYAPLVDQIFNRLDNNALLAVTFPITLAECLIVPIRLGQTDLQRDFMDLITLGTGVIFKEIDKTTATRAAEMRARYNLTLTDAFQVAIAFEMGCNGFLTNDIGLQRS